MTIRSAAAACLLAALCVVPLTGPRSAVSAQPSRIMPLSEVKPGMVGVGRTVFQGAELSDFKVEIIGVLKNIMGPRRDLILAKLHGGPLAETGVAAGMSGSPVYIDGRLIGAVGYSIGAFPKEAIAGITPIEEMKDATAMPARRTGEAAVIELPITLEGLAARLRQSYTRAVPISPRPNDMQAIGLRPGEAAQLATMLQPIATPLLLSGFEPEAVQLLGGIFRDAGFAPVAGAAAGSGPSDEEREAMNGPLREGDAVGVALVGGDVSMGATGTIRSEEHT